MLVALDLVAIASAVFGASCALRARRPGAFAVGLLMTAAMIDHALGLAFIARPTWWAAMILAALLAVLFAAHNRRPASSRAGLAAMHGPLALLAMVAVEVAVAMASGAGPSHHGGTSVGTIDVTDRALMTSLPIGLASVFGACAASATEFRILVQSGAPRFERAEPLFMSTSLLAMSVAMLV